MCCTHVEFFFSDCSEIKSISNVVNIVVIWPKSVINFLRSNLALQSPITIASKSGQKTESMSDSLSTSCLKSLNPWFDDGK